MLSILFVYFIVPEMKGRKFEELEYMFQNGVPLRKFKGKIQQLICSKEKRRVNFVIGFGVPEEVTHYEHPNTKSEIGAD